MSVQTSYPLNTAVALEGHLDSTAIYDSTSRAVEGEIGFGRAVVRGTNPGTQVILPSGPAPVFYGVAIRIIGHENTLNNNQFQPRISYYNKETAEILRAGYIWVWTEQAVTPADPVYYRYAAGSETVIGRFRKDADTATAALLDGASFEGSAGAGTLVLLRLPAIAQ